jgi:hypothetical protein
MSLYEELKQAYAQANPEQRLEILRHELLRPLVTVRGVAALLREYDADLVRQLPDCVSADEFEHLLRWLSEACDDLEQIVAALNATDTRRDPQPAH